MSYNFWYKFVILKENKDEFINFIKSHGEFYDTTRYVANFEWDEALSYFLRSNGIGKPLEDGNIVSIGNLFFEELCIDTAPDIVAFSFMAATMEMSSLFKESASVYNWFLELSKISISLLTYIDFEHLGYRIVFHKGTETNIDIKYDSSESDYTSVPHYHEIMNDFRKYAKDYFLGQ